LRPTLGQNYTQQYNLDSTIIKQTNLQVQTNLQKYGLSTTGSKAEKKICLQWFLSKNNLSGLIFKLYHLLFNIIY